jgi:Co/Zn/Cd efflux system component
LLSSLAPPVLITLAPLVLQESTEVLLQRNPSLMEYETLNCIAEINKLKGVTCVRASHFWMHSQTYLVGTLHIGLEDGAEQQPLLKEACAVLTRHLGLAQFVVQFEKKTYYDACSAGPQPTILPPDTVG